MLGALIEACRSCFDALADMLARAQSDLGPGWREPETRATEADRSGHKARSAKTNLRTGFLLREKMPFLKRTTPEPYWRNRACA